MSESSLESPIRILLLLRNRLLDYSTYLGIATGFAISVDSSGYMYVAGLGQSVPDHTER